MMTLDGMKILEGHYLNLPVLENGTITGMVDVLKLTYVTLEQMSNIEGERDGNLRFFLLMLIREKKN